MQGFCDQIARQYDTLIAQTQNEPTASEDFLTPVRTDVTNSDNWLELGEYNDETMATSKSY
jgi:hypothetical protein